MAYARADRLAKELRKHKVDENDENNLFVDGHNISDHAGMSGVRGLTRKQSKENGSLLIRKACPARKANDVLLRSKCGFCRKDTRALSSSCRARSDG